MAEPLPLVLAAPFGLAICWDVPLLVGFAGTCCSLSAVPEPPVGIAAACAEDMVDMKEWPNVEGGRRLLLLRR